MRVALSCPYAWDAPGGVQTHVRQLAAALEAHGHDVLVLAPAREPSSDAQRARAGPRLHLVGRTVPVPFGGSVAPLCPSPLSLRRIRALLLDFAPDVLHAHEPFSPSTSMLATLASKAPVVATFHSFIERSRLMELFGPALRFVDRRLAASVAVSEAAAECAARVVRRRVEVVPNGVAIGASPKDGARAARFSGPPVPHAHARTVLWAHRLDPRKGFPVAVRAFARLAAELDDVQLVVVGDGRDREALALLPEAVYRRITMLGAAPDGVLASLRSTAHAFVASAVGRESFGVSLLEAMAAGVPVVASDIPGYRELVSDGVDGLLVPPRDPDALARALRRVLTEPSLAASLARAGRERARDFSWDVVVPRLEAIYERVAAPAAHPPARVSAA